MSAKRLIPALLVAVMAASGGAAQVSPPLAQDPPAGAVTGIVYDAVTGQPLAGAIVTLSRLDGGTPIPRSVTDSKGRFIFRQLEPSDQYFLGARRFGYEYTRYGWTGPNQSLTISDIARIALAKDQWVENIRIPLWRLGYDRRTHLSGRLETASGEPVSDVFVLAFSADRATWGPYSRRVKAVRPGRDGTFVFSGLPAGEYLLAALADADPDDWQNPAFLEQVVPAAVKVTLAGGTPVVQNLRIGR